MNSQSAKELFFWLGSLAGITAFIRPLLESKFESDREKTTKILETIPEEVMRELEFAIWQVRRVPVRLLNGLETISADHSQRMTYLTFHGPLKSFLAEEVSRIVRLYEELRSYVQVPYWCCRSSEEGDDSAFEWTFDRTHFEDEAPGGRDYVVYLEGPAERAGRIRDCVRRVQVLREVHFLESYLAKLFLKERLTKVELERPTVACQVSQPDDVQNTVRL